MTSRIKLFMGVAALTVAVAMPVMAQVKSVTEKTSSVASDGSVTYESQTVTTKGAGTTIVTDPVVTKTVSPDTSSTSYSTTTVTRSVVKPGAVTFYYYDPKLRAIVSGSELTNEIISLWDADKNNVIDNHEFYTNALVVYEPIEYSKRTYQDIDGVVKLKEEEYTLRLQQLPAYRNLNKDGKEGLTLYEFTGVGFQDADLNNNNQVGFDELKTAFFAKEGLIRKPLKLNR